jgi:putative ABC transport system permease protein
MIKQYFLMAWRGMKGRPLRSWLTIFGIVIGVFLITSLLSLTEGMKETITNQLRMMGGDLVMVMPGSSSDMMTSMMGGARLSDQDIEAIGRAQGVETVVAMPYGVETVRYLEETNMTFLAGVDWQTGLPVLQENMGFEIKSGTWPIPGRREVLIGQLVPVELFPDIVPGDTIMIKGRPFTVAGMLRSIGSKQDDSSLYMDLSDFRSVTGQREGAQMVAVKINTPEAVENIRIELEETRKKIRGEEQNFSIITSETAMDMINNIMNIVQLAVIVFASIAVLVGGIGITNTMYTSVYERTKEIGILKAVGAKRSAIAFIFMIESGAIGAVGGLGGVIMGLGVAKILEAIGQINSMFLIEASFSIFIPIFGILFSFLVGCLAGFFPARQAARLNPVTALRYE